MTREDIDILWNKALGQAIKEGEQFTRYHFATLVAAAEREAIAQMIEDIPGCSQYFPHVVESVYARGETA